MLTCEVSATANQSYINKEMYLIYSIVFKSVLQSFLAV